MLLFDLIDALERKAREDNGGAMPPVGGPVAGWPSLPTLPGSAITPLPPASPTPPWMPGAQPPGPFAWPVPAGRAPTLIDLLHRGFPPAPSAGSPSPWLLSAAAMPAADEGPSPTGTEEPDPGATGDIAGAEALPNDDEPAGAPQLAQAPKQPKSNLPYPPPPRPWRQRQPDEPYQLPSPDAAKTIGPKSVAIPQEDGSFEVRNGGTRTWRNNNPGALKYKKDQNARANGAVGIDDDGFAIFPTYEIGKAAAMSTLRRKSGTLDDAIKSWAPKVENNTAGYQSFVQHLTGLSGSTRMQSLTPQQLGRLYDAVKRKEGWEQGATTRQPATR